MGLMININIEIKVHLLKKLLYKEHYRQITKNNLIKKGIVVILIYSYNNNTVLGVQPCMHTI